MGKGTSGILLLLLGMFLLMLAISGRFHDIFTAAFPSLGGSAASSSGSGSSSTTPDTTGLGGTGTGSGGGGGGSGTNPQQSSDALVYNKSVYQSGGFQIVPTSSGGFEYVA